MSSPSHEPQAALAGLDLERLRPRLHRYCARMVGSTLEGEDIVQDALLRALEAQPPGRPIDNPEAWLLRIAHNLALDALRRRARRAEFMDEDDMDAVPDPVDEQARRDAAAATLPAFMQLPASQRSVVILFDVLDYSALEVGDLLGLSVPAVKSLLQRGRSRLRELATAPAAVSRTPLTDASQQVLRRYVELFNARDFDTLRTLLAADVRLDLVNRLHLQGPAVGEYFGRYAQVPEWKASPGLVEGQPALLMHRQAREDATPDYFVVLGLDGERVATIRDFLFASYAMADAEHTRLP